MQHCADKPRVGPLLTLTLAAFCATPCLAQVNNDPDAPAVADAPAKPAPPAANVDAPWLEPLIQKLDSDDFKVRERTASDIQTDVRLNLATLQARVADASRPLSPEQQLRLNEIAVRLFRQTVRGAMGVSFSRSVPEGVEIGMTIANFDAIHVLRPGDIIQKMDGIPVITNDEARAVIISHDPGEEVKLSILRNGEPLDVGVRLGKFQDLANAYTLNDRTLREAWRLRCERDNNRLDAVKTPIDAGLTPDQWAQIENNQNRKSAQVESVRAISRNPFPDDDAAEAIIGGGTLRKLDREPMIDFVANDIDARNSAHARNFQIQIDQLTTTLRAYERELARQQNMPAERRDAIRRQMTLCRQQIQQLRNERQRVIKTLQEIER